MPTNKTRLVGWLLVAGGALDWLARLGGIHADTPGLLESVASVISAAFELLGLSGIAIILGALLLAWGTWGHRIRVWWIKHGWPAWEAMPQPDAKPEVGFQLIDERLAAMDAKINDLSQRCTNEFDIIRKDLHMHLEFARPIMEHAVVEELIRRIPKEVEHYFDQSEFTMDWIRNQYILTQSYIDYVSRQLDGTLLSDDITRLLHEGETDGDRVVSNIPLERRPANVDPYKFQSYARSRTKYDYIHTLL